MMIKVYCGDAKIWMKTAKRLYECNRENFRKMAGYPHSNELNVAAVCAGYAFELVYKAIVATVSQPREVHSPSTSHQELCPADRADLKRIIASHGWKVSEFLRFLDDDLCNPSRKYWMVKDGSTSPVRFSVGGKLDYEKLSDLHEEMVKFALERIKRTSVHEAFPGIY